MGRLASSIAAVDDERVELVGERAGLAVFLAVIHLPLRIRSVAVAFADADLDASLSGEPVDGIAGEGCFYPDRR